MIKIQNRTSLAHIVCVFLCATFMIFQGMSAQESKLPFHPNGTYLSEIPTPDEVLGLRG